LLRDTVAELARLGYRSYLLEVITTNTVASTLYANTGLHRTRRLDCFRAPRLSAEPVDPDVFVSPIDPAWMSRVAGLIEYAPSWQNESASVDEIADACCLVDARRDGRTVAFAVLIPQFGNLMQIGWNDADAFRSVLARASAEAVSDTLTVINLPQSAFEIRRALETSGFQRFISQYEMELDLRAGSIRF
jgi:hypothetical protein